MRKFATKKILAVSMAAAMAVSMTACGSKGEGDAVPTPAPDTTATPAPDGSSDTGNQPVVDENATYTYNYSLTDFPTNWNIHRYETEIDAEIVDYIVSGFYRFDYNDTLDGYSLKPDMLSKDVEDITADYVGQYGIEAGDTARVWKLTLREDLKWDDGTAITAQDFVTSAKLLLNPIAQNHRADMLYSGSLAIVNAKDYLYSGQHVYATTVINGTDFSGYVAPADLVADENGVFTVDGKDIAINLNDGANWSSNSLADYYGAYPDWFTKDGVDMYATVLEANADSDGWVKVTQEVMDVVNQFVACAHGAADVDAYAESAGDYAYQEWEEFAYYGETYPEIDFAEVGINAPSDYELVLVLTTPLDGFYLHYALTSSWLVKEDLYLSCESIVDGVYNNTYGTSVETSASYGPYKVASFQADKEYVLERNDNYWGITENTYQTTHIKVSCVAEASTKLEYFLSGQLDSYGLTADDMETYQSSDYTYYTTGASTYYVALNPDMDALIAAQEALGTGYNKTILTVEAFRKALSLALDRSAFALAVSPTNNAAFGIFSNLIICDPEAGTGYRSTEQAKWVLARFWGLENEIGEGKMYETVDDAVDSITGYSLAQAKELFNEAYDTAIAEGLMTENDTIQIKIGLPNSTSNFYSKGYEFLVNCYTEAVVGTSLEGKLTFVMDDTLGNNFGNALRSNQVDMLFGVGWSGSALDPYSLVEAYTSTEYQYDPRWDTSKAMVTVNLNGTDYTASAWDWTLALAGTEITITAADGSTTTFSAGSSDGVNEERFEILVALEDAILQTYDLLPMLDASSASLKGMQVEYYTEEYIYGVGRHGAYRYLTYNYSDTEWEEFVASQGGQLNYK